MNTQLLPLTAAALFALCAGSALVASHHARADIAAARTAASSATASILDMPTVTVRPAAADLAYFQANRIVDLAAITVRPEPQDVSAYLASSVASVVDMPSVTVRPSVDDVRIAAVGAMALVQQMAAR